MSSLTITFHATQLPKVRVQIDNERRVGGGGGHSGAEVLRHLEEAKGREGGHEVIFTQSGQVVRGQVHAGKQLPVSAVKDVWTVGVKDKQVWYIGWSNT